MSILLNVSKTKMKIAKGMPFVFCGTQKTKGMPFVFCGTQKTKVLY